MKYEFKSGFAAKIRSHIEQKKSLGFSYSNIEFTLFKFDKMCASKFQGKSELTQEICLAWATKKESENVRSFRNRISPVREFGKYLIRNGESAFIIPNDFAKKSPRYHPYIYSHEDIARIWDEFDRLESTNLYPAKQEVLSAIVRVLYCCGLRPIEARRLKMADVDLMVGKFFIRESKGHKDRIVMLAEDLTEYLRKYNDAVRKIFPEREWFFPNVRGGFCPSSWLNDNFFHICQKLKIGSYDGKPPRMYDLRHTMVTHRLYGWMKSGENIDERLQYLSRYVGHELISDTYYYIHLVPEQLQTMSGFDLRRYENLLPEAEYND